MDRINLETPVRWMVVVILLGAVLTGNALADSLNEILMKQPTETRLRYNARHPQQTLEFFQVEPGTTVMEVLPGGGWYSKILAEYLGPDGLLVGADYALDMYPKFNF